MYAPNSSTSKYVSSASRSELVDFTYCLRASCAWWARVYCSAKGWAALSRLAPSGTSALCSLSVATKRAKAVPMPLRETEEYSLRPAGKNYLNRAGLSSSSAARFFLCARFMNCLIRSKTVSAVRV